MNSAFASKLSVSVLVTGLAAIGYVSPVRASEVCNDIDEIVAAGKGLFRSLIGSRTEVPDWYNAKKVLPAAYECIIDTDGREFGDYWCDWRFSDQSSAKRHFDALKAAVSPCLENRSDVRDRGERKVSERLTIFESRTFDDIFDNDVYAVEADLDLKKVDSKRRGTHYEVTLNFSVMYW